jgi:hypothetical protein
MRAAMCSGVAGRPQPSQTIEVEVASMVYGSSYSNHWNAASGKRIRIPGQFERPIFGSVPDCQRLDQNYVFRFPTQRFSGPWGGRATRPRNRLDRACAPVIYRGNLVPDGGHRIIKYMVERVQTGVRMEKRLLKVLRAFADYHDLTLGDLLEGIVLHAFDGKRPFNQASLRRIKDLKRFYALDLDSRASHRLTEARARQTVKKGKRGE